MENQEINEFIKDPQGSGELVDRDEKGRFLDGHPKMGGIEKGWKSPKKRLAEMWKEIPPNQRMSRGDALLLKVWNMAIVEGNEAMIRIIFGYLEGLPRQSIKFEEDAAQMVKKDEKFQEGLNKVLEVFENLKKPRKTFKYEEPVVETENNGPYEFIPKEEKKEKVKEPGVGIFYSPPDDPKD